MAVAKKVKDEEEKKVVEVASQAISSPALSAYAGAGFEDVQAGDLKLPIFKLLQSGSPEIKKTELEYVEGAEEGWWFDTISKRYYQSLIVVPTKFVTHWIEWRPNQGGFVANHGADARISYSCVRDPDTNKLITKEGNELVQTSTWFCYVVSGLDPV